MNDAIKILISRLRHDIRKDTTFYDKKVAIMIADAKKIRKDRSNRRKIDRVMYDYSIALEAKSGDALYSFNEYQLSRTTYQKLLAIFESI